MTIAPVRRLVIANRGEIACRIIRTARRLGITTIAVYSAADANSLHVQQADQAYAIGAAPARESYLHIPALLAVAQQSGAEAIHPGYGFLSEKAEFAEAVTAAGLRLVGPPAAAMRLMGDKARAKAAMRAAGVPLLPGYEGDDQSDVTLRQQAERLGLPLLLKAAAGGGGKGIRLVTDWAEWDELLAAVREEARRSFADDRILLERYVTRPRHVEVQILADSHGTVLAIGDRDCSLQRRNQKVVEEAPAPDLPDAVRAHLHAAAVAAARACGYVNAGTVEFLFDGREVYFLEMNTRLQVEHPVTEAVYGLDLVEWQLRITAGEKLPFHQEQLAHNGHAVEVRLCAEDPAADFRPATGRITALHWPPAARIDTGVAVNDAISMFYDSMIAKIIVHGPDRLAALQSLRAALAATHVGGLTCNLNFLRRLLARDEFAAGPCDTGFIARQGDTLLSDPPPPATAWAAAAMTLRQHQRHSSASWGEDDGFRLLGRAPWRITLRHGETEGTVALTPDQATTPAGPVGLVALPPALCDCPGQVIVTADGCDYHFAHQPTSAERPRRSSSSGTIRAPMPGQIVQVLVREGETVAAQAPLLVLEAMKMLQTLKSPAAGTVRNLRVQAGDQVSEGAALADVA